MDSKNIATFREYWRAGENGDWPAAGRCIGPGYVWIDHGTGVVAHTPDEFREALADDMAWSNLRFEIDHIFDTQDGAVVVQAVRSGSITGQWRSMEAAGQQVVFPVCTIFKFDEDHHIVHEEAYYDMLSVRRQLGY